MVGTCAAPGCKNRVKQKSGITFHMFPKGGGLREAWARAIRRDDWAPKDSDRLCSVHFKAECFDRTGQTVRLRAGSMPTLFPAAQLLTTNKSKKITPSKRQHRCQVQAKAKLTSSSSHKQKAHGRATRAATKVQEKKAVDQAAKQSKTKDAGTNTTSLGEDVPAEAGASSSNGQPLPKKQLFQLRHEAKDQSTGQAKGSEDTGTSQPAPVDVEEPVNGSKSKGLEPDNMSNCSGEPEECHAIDRTVNRDLESGEPGPETTAVGALFLHTYCGERTEPNEVVRLKKLLQIAKRHLALADRKMKRKSEAFNELLTANKELKFQLSLAQRPTQQQFSVSERLPQELLRDWHENAGRVPHARRYSPTTLRFAADLHACSRTAYEHVARWLPMPTLYLVRRHNAMSSSGDSSQESGVHTAVTAPRSKGETAPAGPQITTVPASRFASSVPRIRKLAAGFPSAASKPNASTFPPVQSTAKLEKPPVMQASHNAPAVFVINNATPPAMATPPEAAVLPEMATSTKVATSSETTTLPETETQLSMDTEPDTETQPEVEAQ
ncbi:uncharacterized protein LOC119455598 isoform X2 [Dermacentor silvarum]|uniref:uncharacterized protein LOC119455598 isoform X2 n=1 Tax=Dermacentor silvarum TaxID=543639 RepID=UPI00189730EE|nr:uncharacterized protein LOC119455598 isoform X2 [Dermacentor silvarum]